MSDDTVVLRVAVAADAEAISALVSGLTRSTIAPDCTPAGATRLLASMTPESIRGYLEQGFRYHVAVRADALIGAIALRDRTHIYHLFVATEWQGRGVARRLWETARDAALADPAHARVFSVNSSRNAQQIYRRLGFRPVDGELWQEGVVSVPMRIAV